MPKKHFTKICCLFLAVCGARLDAQILPLQHYTIKDGLPSNWITTVFQDSRGYLWIGGDGGMSVYDGVSFKNYDTDDGLPVGHVWSIQESRQEPGTMLIGTHGGGLSKLQDGKITSRTLGSSPASNVIAKIVEDREGVIWCGSVWGVYRVDGDSASFFSTGKDTSWPDFAEHREKLVSLFARNENHRAPAA
jgi:ligand-binding sensor domain-containing protein